MFSPNEFVIAIIKHGVEDLRSGGDGLTFDDLKGKMETEGFQIKTPEDHQKIWRVIKTAFIHPEGIGSFNRYFLSIEAYFSFMDFVQLQETRESSQSSKRLAITAIFFAAASLLSAVGFSYAQMQGTVSIDSKQLSSIESRLDAMNTQLAEMAKNKSPTTPSSSATTQPNPAFQGTLRHKAAQRP